MINVSVRENYAADWCAQTLRCFVDASGRASKAGINESEAIVFPDQEAIDHAEPSQAKQIV
jgi:hypothetical protein